MVFSSLIFIFLYLFAVIPVYYALPRKFKNTFLFIVSLVFYSYGEPIFIILMILSVGMNYAFGLLIEKNKGKKNLKKVLLITNIIINIGMLGFFKYAGFFVDTIKLIPAFSSLNTPEIPLPIGISFYTFQIMSYTIDVYRNECKAQRSFISLGTYIALFPQLIAGPIVMYVDIENQLGNRKESFEKFNKGVKLFMLGLFKKVMLANALGEMWSALKGGESNGILGAWLGIIAFTLQILFDFSGYSDMARGLGNMLGFEFL